MALPPKPVQARPVSLHEHSPVHQSSLLLKASDGVCSRLTHFVSQRSGARGPVVLCISAMGVKASYYRPLGCALAAVGFEVLTVDLRGHGTSSVRPGRTCDFGYMEMVRRDLSAALAKAYEMADGRPVVIAGHSLGGQLGCLLAALEPAKVDALLLLTSCSVYFRCWDFPLAWGLWGFYQTSRWTAQILGHYPGHVFRFAGRESRGVAWDWSHQGLTGLYQPRGMRENVEAALRKSEVPVLAMSFTDDWYAPPKAVQHLLDKMPCAPRVLHHLAPSSLGLEKLGHFGWVKQAEHFVPLWVAWLERHHLCSSAPSTNTV